MYISLRKFMIMIAKNYIEFRFRLFWDTLYTHQRAIVHTQTRTHTWYKTLTILYYQQCQHAHCTFCTCTSTSCTHVHTSCTPPPFFLYLFLFIQYSADVTRFYFIFEAVFDFKLSLMMAVSCIFHFLAISPCYILLKTKLYLHMINIVLLFYYVIILNIQLLCKDVL